MLSCLQRKREPKGAHEGHLQLCALLRVARHGCPHCLEGRENRRAEGRAELRVPHVQGEAGSRT